jgi:hypothetical protein
MGASKVRLIKPVIASAAKQSIFPSDAQRQWIASLR